MSPRAISAKGNAMKVKKMPEIKKGKTVVTEKPKIDVGKIAQEIMTEQIRKQKSPLKKVINGVTDKTGKISKRYVNTGIEGFDALLKDGIPKGSTILVAGGAGCGKTIFCLQTLANKAKAGKKCLKI